MSLGREDQRAMYRAMCLVRVVDERMLTLQRQGRIGFYGAATGQEAAVIGSGWALEPRDWVLPALREGGVALLRGYSLADYTNQLFGNRTDLLKGRQMPCHYGDRKVNYVTLSSPIATQLPQAVGVALAQKLEGAGAITIGYMGDGATSEADFHVAMEFAARLKAPVVFFCQNNQWAISTGWRHQTAAETLADKAQGYGMPGARVDGNDVVAVYEATKVAVDRARAEGTPSFIEALTYRIGAHSTSDDPSRYRDESVTAEWRKRDPIARHRATLVSRGWWSDAEEAGLLEELTAQVKAETERAEAEGPPDLDTLFEDVYAVRPRHLAEQAQALAAARGRR